MKLLIAVKGYDYGGRVMYKLLLYETLKDTTIGDKWRKMYADNRELTPFQSFEWNKVMIENQIYEGKLCLFVFEKNNETIIIAPLVVKKKPFYNEVTILGENTHSDYLNFIYDNSLQFEDFRSFINELFKLYKIALFNFNYINEASRIQVFLKRMDNEKTCRKSICVKIPIVQEEEQYYKSLSQNTRRMIRKRLKAIEEIKDKVSFRFYFGSALDEELVEAAVKLYTERQKEKYNKSIREKYLKYLTQAVKECPNSFMAICNIDEQLAACQIGLISNRNDICTMIFAINSNYSSYAIGNMLLYKVIAQLIRRNKGVVEDGLKCHYDDLTRGNELYKYHFGGKEHYNYHFSLWNRRSISIYTYAACRVKLVFKEPLYVMHRVLNIYKEHSKTLLPLRHKQLFSQKHS